MFVLLKQRLDQLDGPKWAAIFVFEFIVVLLGVLAAQTLQERFQQRQARESFDASRAALNRQLDNVGTSMIQRGLQAPCVTQNLEQIIAAVEAGRPLPDGVFTNHPPKGSGELTVWDGSLAAQTRKYLTEQEASAYEFIGLVAVDLRNAAQREESDWATLALAKNNAGSLGDAGKTQVLLAANNLLHAYEGWERAPATLVGLMKGVGAKALPDRITQVNAGEALCSQSVLAGLAQLKFSAEEGMD